MSVAYVECFAGVKGDMFLGAWLHLGIDEDEWLRIIGKLKLAKHRISIQSVFRQGIAALRVDVDSPALAPKQRGLAEVMTLLEESDLPLPVLEKTRQAFNALAEAEGQVCGLPLDQVHLHEFTADGTIVEVVGVMVGWYLAGMPDCYVSPIELGGGTVTYSVRTMPIPAPATTVLLQGFPAYSSGIWGETVTPTGAAMVKTLCKPGPLPIVTFERVGYGAGTKDTEVANTLRIQLGTVPIIKQGTQHPVAGVGSTPDYLAPRRDFQVKQACMIEANIDDMNPELGGYVIARLLEHGAMDAWFTPISMKKGRLAFQLQVLCTLETRERIIREIFLETTTIGVRFYEVGKVMLHKRIVDVDTNYGRVRVKVADDGENDLNVAPEFEDCRQQAELYRVPLKQVYHAALTSYYVNHKNDSL